MEDTPAQFSSPIPQGTNPIGMLESKTLKFWLVLFGLALIVVLFATAVQIVFHTQVPFVSDFFQLLGLGGGVGSARNVTADHIVPMLQNRPGGAVQPTQPNHPTSTF